MTAANNENGLTIEIKIPRILSDETDSGSFNEE